MRGPLATRWVVEAVTASPGPSGTEVEYAIQSPFGPTVAPERAALPIESRLRIFPLRASTRISSKPPLVTTPPTVPTSSHVHAPLAPSSFVRELSGQMT